MKTPKALEIISFLADGVNPHTGEIFESTSIYQHPDTVRALYKAKDSLEWTIKAEKRKRRLPENAGTKWEEDEDIRLKEAFENGKTVADLTKIHKRTNWAIRRRLQRLGLI